MVLDKIWKHLTDLSKASIKYYICIVALSLCRKEDADFISA